jgi:fatty acid desaturase
MQEQFFPMPSALASQWPALTQRNDSPSKRRFLVQYWSFLVSAALVTAGPGDNVWTSGLFAVAMIAFCVLVTSLFAIVHETMHGTAFASKRWNALCNVLAGAPIFYTPVGFRAFHAAHHRHTNHPTLDPERAIAGQPGPLPLAHLPVYLGFVSGLPVLIYKAAVIVLGAIAPRRVLAFLLPYLPAHRYAAFRRQCWAVVAVHTVWLWAASAWGGGVLWIGLAQWWGHTIQSIYLLAEHNGLPMGEGTIVERTRSLRTPSWWRWVMWNMPLHAEHHAWPAVPWYHLPAVHALVAIELAERSDSVGGFHARAWRGFVAPREPSKG